MGLRRPRENEAREALAAIEALHGRIRNHHRGLLKVHLDLVTALQHGLAELDATVGKTLASIQEGAHLLSTIPGVSDITGNVIVAEIGLDMTRFASDAHLRSWAGFCPRNNESAGKRRFTRVRKGAPWLETTLISAAWAAVRVKDSYLQAQFHRLRARRGAKKAILVVASSMLTPPVTCSETAWLTRTWVPATSPDATAAR